MASQNYIRKGRKYDPDEVLIHVRPAQRRKMKVDFDGDEIKVTSDRLFTFRQSLTCARCGIIASFFAKERCRNQSTFHFNLYAINDSGHEVLMTKDHIIPKAKSGPDHPDNYQTMCRDCNVEKKDGL